MRVVPLLGTAGLLCLTAFGCGGRSSVNQSSTPPCETRVPAERPADTVTVVVFDKIVPSHAPAPQNREERFVFSHLYETLVKIDCHGQVRPGLAKSWKPGSDGWLVELREGAQFWDQSPVTSDDVVTSFDAAIKKGLAIRSIDVIDDRTFLVKGDHGAPDITLLALPMVAICRESDTDAPMGTGAWQFDSDIPVAEGVVIQPVVTALGPVVRFMQANPSDAKDLVAGKADAMITDDPEAIDYARERHATMTPLPWDRAYMLLSATRYAAIERSDPVAPLPEAVSNVLARDAVRVDARGGSSLIIDANAAFPVRIRVSDAPTPNGIRNPVHRVMFASADATARGLAERMVALAAMDTSSSEAARALVRAVPGAAADLRAAGLNSKQFVASLAAGDEFAYVVALSWYTDFPFFLQEFERTTWSPEGPNVAQRVLPLVETRAHFVALNERIGYTHDETGNVYIMITEREQKR